MRCLSESEVRDWFKDSFGSKSVPKIYFKKVKVKSDFILTGNRKLANGKYFSGFKSGKTYNLWIVKADNQPLVVFVPGLSEGMVIEFDDFEENLDAQDSFDACLDGVRYRLIKNWKGQRILVPEWCFFIDKVENLYEGQYAYCSAEMVIDKEEWYVGWAFYQHLNETSYPDNCRKWLAFYRIDTQSFVSREECDTSYDKLKVALSSFPIRKGNMEIKFLYPGEIGFEFK